VKAWQERSTLIAIWNIGNAPDLGSRGSRGKCGSEHRLSAPPGPVRKCFHQIPLSRRHTFCGANCTICDTDCHPLNAPVRARSKDAEAAAIEIGDDVFLGVNGVVLEGVRIGNGTLCSSKECGGSVFTSSRTRRAL
jgi:hypothetical protein